MVDTQRGDSEPLQIVQESAAQYKYKGNFRKCAAIQIVFEYFELLEMIKMQRLSRRFYSYTIKGICPIVPLRSQQDYTELMKRQVTRVMLFCEQTRFYTLSAETGYKWTS